MIMKQAYLGAAKMGAASLYFGRHLPEYAGLLAAFLKLYWQGRALMARNYVLSCQLGLWEVVFLSLRIQIFLTRLAQGFPVGQCWPRK